MDQTYPHEREHFRVPYQVPDTPRFEVKALPYPVLDLSEGGLRLAITSKHRPNLYGLDQPIMGTLYLPQQRGTLCLSGRVIRVADDYIAIQLSKESHIPLSHIMEEQRQMILNLPQNSAKNNPPGQRKKS